MTQGSSRPGKDKPKPPPPAAPATPDAPGSPVSDDEGFVHDFKGEVVDRRSGLDRREVQKRLGLDKAAPSGLERRRGPGRRRSDFMKAAEEGEMTEEQFVFLLAIDTFKRVNNKTFPSWTDVLEVIRLLGYRKTCSSELNLGRLDDWREKPDAPSDVRTRSDLRLEE